MTTPAPHPSEAPLPTLNKLGVSSLPEDIDAPKIASEWFASFSDKITSNDVDGVISLLVQSSFNSALPETANQPSVYWRDLLALTWDFRTFEGTPRIRKFLSDCLVKATKIGNLQLKTENDAQGLAPLLARPFPDVAWVMGMFTFETNVGISSGIFRLVPTLDGEQQLQWKAHCIFTNLEELKGFPEKVGHLRNQEVDHGKWESRREKEKGFEERDPTVLIIGAGHSGLEVAARLRLLGVDNLIVDKNERVGDNWRDRYEALCLHDVVWYDHLPYIPFPPNWPTFTPAKKLANWLEFYAESMELNIWTSTKVSNIQKDNTTGLYKVTVQTKKSERVFTVKHVVFATGFVGNVPNMPTYPGMDTFKGKILHSSQHKKATDHSGKKVVLIGSCTSAHDIGVEYSDHGIDVTMYQRSPTYVMSVQKGIRILLSGAFEENGPPTVVADRLSASFPNLLNLGVHYRVREVIEEADKETLDGLRRVGFKLTRGYKDSGVLLCVFKKAGGYYLDVGGSQYIIDGKIKLKNDATLESFSATGLKFADGSELPADVVVFCTGLGNARDAVQKILDPDLFADVGEIWGLNDEGEFNGVWGDIGVRNMWYMMGNFAVCRFYSKHIALQIKAIEEGLAGERYRVRI